jgi:hypothetical protein
MHKKTLVKQGFNYYFEFFTSCNRRFSALSGHFDGLIRFTLGINGCSFLGYDTPDVH